MARLIWSCQGWSMVSTPESFQHIVLSPIRFAITCVMIMGNSRGDIVVFMAPWPTYAKHLGFTKCLVFVTLASPCMLRLVFWCKGFCALMMLLINIANSFVVFSPHLSCATVSRHLWSSSEIWIEQIKCVLGWLMLLKLTILYCSTVIMVDSLARRFTLSIPRSISSL